MWMKEAVVLENESLPPPSFAGAIIESHQFVHARATAAATTPAPAHACSQSRKRSTRSNANPPTDRPKGLL